MTTSSSPPSPPSAAPEQLQHLRSLCGGAVHLPGDPLYDEARVPWNLHVDTRPAAVAYPAFPDEVAAVLRGAAAAGLKVAPQGTGHGAPPLAGRLGDAVLLRTSAMTELAIDAERRTARVGAGVLWGDVIQRAWEAELAARHMSSPTVGVVGSSLGGGISWYGRAHGLQSSALTAVEVVLADGTFVRATEDSDSELLWAARGGGGGFGVVTAVEFGLLPVTGVCAGMMVWDWKDARRVLGAWAEWAVEAPDAVTSVARLLQAPDLGWLPEGIRGRQVVVIDGVVLGDERQAEALLAPLRSLRPDLDTFQRAVPPDLASMHLDPEEPTAVYANSVLLDELPEAAVEALMENAGPDSGSRLMFVELRQLGGALSRPSPRGGALDRVDGRFLVLTVGVDDGSGMAAVRRDANRVLRSLEPWASSALYLLMVDEEVDGRRGWPRAPRERLAAVRAIADPGGLFLSAHSALQ